LDSGNERGLSKGLWCPKWGMMRRLFRCGRMNPEEREIANKHVDTTRGNLRSAILGLRKGMEEAQGASAR